MSKKNAMVIIGTINRVALANLSKMRVNTLALKKLDEEHNKKVAEFAKTIADCDALYRAKAATEETDKIFHDAKTGLDKENNKYSYAKKPLQNNINEAYNYWDLKDAYKAYCADLRDGTRTMHKYILAILEDAEVVIEGDKTKAVDKFVKKLENYTYGAQTKSYKKQTADSFMSASSSRTWCAKFCTALAQCLIDTGRFVADADTWAISRVEEKVTSVTIDNEEAQA